MGLGRRCRQWQRGIQQQRRPAPCGDRFHMLYAWIAQAEAQKSRTLSTQKSHSLSNRRNQHTFCMCSTTQRSICEPIAQRQMQPLPNSYRLFQLLLRAELVGVTALLLAAVGGTRGKAGVALAADHLLAVVLGSQGLERGLNDTTTETEDQVESRLLLRLLVFVLESPRLRKDRQARSLQRAS